MSAYANVNYVAFDYLKTLEIPLLRGRFFNAAETLGSQPIAMVDQTLSKRYFTGEDPIGQSLKTPGGNFRIIGVVGSVKTTGVDVDGPPTIYFGGPAETLVIRSRLPMAGLTNDVQRMVTQIDKDQPVHEVSLLETSVNHSLKTRRFVVFLVTLFVIAGALLSALGIYGLLSYSIAVRRREIGIRMAIGATGRAIATLVCFNGLRLVLAGAALGCAGAWVAHRYIASQLYGVGFNDAATWIAVASGILLAGLFACAVPAWRAARTNVLESLRTG